MISNKFQKGLRAVNYQLLYKFWYCRNPADIFNTKGIGGKNMVKKMKI
jgi:hypothetical protein